jgi:hypothetical protein
MCNLALLPKQAGLLLNPVCPQTAPLPPAVAFEPTPAACPPNAASCTTRPSRRCLRTSRQPRRQRRPAAWTQWPPRRRGSGRATRSWLRTQRGGGSAAARQGSRQLTGSPGSVAPARLLHRSNRRYDTTRPLKPAQCLISCLTTTQIPACRGESLALSRLYHPTKSTLLSYMINPYECYSERLCLRPVVR